MRFIPSVPNPVRTLMVSRAISTPITPTTGPSTPTSEHLSAPAPVRDTDGKTQRIQGPGGFTGLAGVELSLSRPCEVTLLAFAALEPPEGRL